MNIVILIRPEAFHIFKNFEYIASRPHRRDISHFRGLCLNFPNINGNGKFFDITIKKVYFGSLSGSELLNAFNIPKPKIVACMVETGKNVASWRRERPYRHTVIVSGLPSQRLDTEVYNLESMLLELFEEFEPIKTDIGKFASYSS